MQQFEYRAGTTESLKKCDRGACDGRGPDTCKDILRRTPQALA